MSDVLNTSAEVIDKNRKLWLDTRGVPVITTTKNGEANAIRWGWTEAKAVAADALAARVPVQGEPNDELIEYALDYIENGTMRPERRKALQALASRATVPDAATEELEAKLENAKAAAKLSHGFLEIEKEEHAETGAERDAALAAIERVRAVLSAWEMVQARNRECFESGNPGMIVPIDCTGGLRAALDGAPEPEWEWGYRGETLIDVHTRKSRKSAEGAVKDLTEYWALHGKKFEVVRRRKAGPWLPVEGESNGA